MTLEIKLIHNEREYVKSYPPMEIIYDKSAPHLLMNAFKELKKKIQHDAEAERLFENELRQEQNLAQSSKKE